MGRWEPNSAGRLREAALELFEERGYEHTTVADIAERAGLTGRTFFRYYADKREVLFGGSDELRSRLAAAVEAAPRSATPMDVVGAALDAVAEALGGDRDWARRRQAVILATPELLERELAKLATFAATVTDGLRERGVGALEAALAGETTVTVLRVAFEQWASTTGDEELTGLVRDALARLRAIVTR